MTAHALLFHQAALRHFANRDVPNGRQIPPFALRFPLSFPVPEGTSAKPLLF